MDFEQVLHRASVVCLNSWFDTPCSPGALRTLLQREGLTMGMSRKGDPWDNAMMESFFGSLKTEGIDNGYATETQARMEVFKYIEMFYNPTRRDSALDYLSPAEYERDYEAGPLTPMEEAALC